MKNFLLQFFACMAVLILGCQDSEYKKKEKAYVDSLTSIYKDSMAKSIETSFDNAYWDTISNYGPAPVKILSARLIKREYSNYRDIALSFKNVSAKTISGIKFRWHGTNAFGDAADMGTSLMQGFGNGFTDDILRPGRSDNGTWSILSKDAKKIQKAWAYEVAFSDGTKWKSDYQK